MTEQVLNQIAKRAEQATPGPWYAHRTDDMHRSNARYVSTEQSRFKHDNKTGLAEGSRQQAQPDRVIAITLLQSPSLARAEDCDENSLFIAHARTDVPKLLAEIHRLRKKIAKLQSKLDK